MDVGPNSKPNPAQISTDIMMIFDICVLALAHVIPESRRSTNSSFPLLALLRNHTSANPDIQTTSRTRNAAIKERHRIEKKKSSPKEGMKFKAWALLYFA